MRNCFMNFSIQIVPQLMLVSRQVTGFVLFSVYVLFLARCLQNRQFELFLFNQKRVPIQRKKRKKKKKIRGNKNKKKRLNLQAKQSTAASTLYSPQQHEPVDMESYMAACPVFQTYECIQLVVELVWEDKQYIA